MDLGKHGSMREIEQTDLRSILYFMVEYVKWKTEMPADKLAYADEVEL